MTPGSARGSSAHQLRIIGGKWKGRKLRVRGSAQLRPTAARTRETLFNWLRPELSGYRCLDAFAGSGALGFEALSQGAKHCTFVDIDRQSLHTLHQHITMLDAVTSCQVVKQRAQQFLQQTEASWDVIFLDPPFTQPSLLEQSFEQIQTRQLCHSALYLEAPDPERVQGWLHGSSWEIAKQTRCGDAWALLLRP